MSYKNKRTEDIRRIFGSEYVDGYPLNKLCNLNLTFQSQTFKENF